MCGGTKANEKRSALVLSDIKTNTAKGSPHEHLEERNDLICLPEGDVLPEERPDEGENVSRDEAPAEERRAVRVSDDLVNHFDGDRGEEGGFRHVVRERVRS